MPQPPGKSRKIPLWLALAPALTSVAAVGELGDTNNMFPTWAEALLLVASIGLLLFIVGANVRQRSRDRG